MLFVSPQPNCKPLQVKEYKACKKFSINVFQTDAICLMPIKSFILYSQNFLVAVGDVVKTPLMLFMGSQVEEGEEIV